MFYRNLVCDRSSHPEILRRFSLRNDRFTETDHRLKKAHQHPSKPPVGLHQNLSYRDCLQAGPRKGWRLLPVNLDTVAGAFADEYIVVVVNRYA